MLTTSVFHPNHPKFSNMKNLRSIMSIALLMLFALACGDSDSKKDEKEVVRETISAKWIVSDVASGRVKSGDFESFEFNKSGSYIVIYNGSVYFGKYEIADDKVTIKLNDFGTLVLISTSDDAISFTFVFDGDEVTYTVTGDKAPEMESSGQTEKLCKTWELVTYNGDAVKGTEMELTVLFSEAGTYFVYNIYDQEGGLAHWQWKDSSEKTLCYSWEGDATCDGDNQVTIVENTSSRLEIDEAGDIYVLKPVSATGRTRTGELKQATQKKREGLFN
jgi:hypothetical protein